MIKILIFAAVIFLIGCEPECNCADSYWILKNDSTITVKPEIKQIEFFNDVGPGGSQAPPALLKITRTEKSIVIEVDTTRGAP